MAYVYLIQDTVSKATKIGIAIDVNKRMAGIKTGNPNPLRLLACVAVADARKVERELHTHFSTLRLSGEWFSMSNGDILHACEMLDACPKTVETPVQQDLPARKDRETVANLEWRVAKNSRLNAWRFERGHGAQKQWTSYEQVSEWRMEILDNGARYVLRRGSGNNRETALGGSMKDLELIVAASAAEQG